MAIKPFGQNVMTKELVVANKVAVADNTAVKKFEQPALRRAAGAASIKDEFVPSTGRTARGTIAGANPDIFSKYLNQDLALAGPGPSFTSKVMANIRKGEEMETSFPQGSEADVA